MTSGDCFPQKSCSALLPSITFRHLYTGNYQGRSPRTLWLFKQHSCLRLTVNNTFPCLVGFSKQSVQWIMKGEIKVWHWIHWIECEVKCLRDKTAKCSTFNQLLKVQPQFCFVALSPTARKQHSLHWLLLSDHMFSCVQSLCKYCLRTHSIIITILLLVICHGMLATDWSLVDSFARVLLLGNQD